MTRNAKVIWEAPRRHLSRQRITIRRRVAIGYNGMTHIYPKTALLLRRSPPKSNAPIPRPTPLTTPNGICIQSAVLPQYTPIRLTDRHMGLATALYHDPFMLYACYCIISASLAIRIAEQSAYVTDHVVPRLSVRRYVLWRYG